MDLDVCPKCGVAWRGWNKCPACGFVPIGVGLDKLPKKKKPKVKKYVEPGSSRGFLTTCFVGALGYFLYANQPWADDWEFVHRLMGDARIHSIKGEWAIAKCVNKRGSAPPVFGEPNIDRGVLSFSPKGTVKFHLSKASEDIQLAGNYSVDGQTLNLTGVTGEYKGVLPKALQAQLSWTGPDLIVATIKGHETLYLRRTKAGEAATPFASMNYDGLKEGTSDAVRGMIGNYKTGDAD